MTTLFLGVIIGIFVTNIWKVAIVRVRRPLPATAPDAAPALPAAPARPRRRRSR
jgi:hypothetical protein